MQCRKVKIKVKVKMGPRVREDDVLRACSARVRKAALRKSPVFPSAETHNSITRSTPIPRMREPMPATRSNYPPSLRGMREPMPLLPAPN